MARRVFFSFDYALDHWRADQVISSHVVAASDRAGFFSPLEHEEAHVMGAEAIRQMLVRHLANTTVTVVLIGTQTAARPLVKHAIEESIKRKNGLLGIRIHHLKDQAGRTSFQGRTPTVPTGIEFPVYSWDGDLDRFGKELEAAERRADVLRKSKG
jgi:hypothetical protein